MVRRITFLALLALLLGVFVGVQRAMATVGTVQVYQGSAEIERGKRVIPGVTGAALRVQDALSISSDGRVAIVLKDGSVVRLEKGSKVRIADLEYHGKKIAQARFALEVGRLWSYVRPLQSSAQFEVETPTIVSAVHGTSFNTDRLGASSVVYVYRSTVGVSLKKDAATRRTESGQVFMVRDDHLREDFDAGPQPADPSFLADEWIQFNAAADDALDGISPSSTPSPTPTTTPTPSPSSEPSPSPTPESRVQGAVTNRLPTPLTPPTPTTAFTPLASPGKRLVSLLLSADRGLLAIGESAKLNVRARYSDGTTTDVSRRVSWRQRIAIGKFSKTLFTATSSGVASITATLDGVTSNAITVEGVQPATATPTPVTAVGLRLTCTLSTAAKANTRTAQCAATAEFSDGSTKEVTSDTQWGLQTPARGTISSSGFYTAGKEAGDVVTASYDGLTASTSIDI